MAMHIEEISGSLETARSQRDALQGRSALSPSPSLPLSVPPSLPLPSLPLSLPLSLSPSLPLSHPLFRGSGVVCVCMRVCVCVFNVDEESTQMKTRDSVRSSRNWG
jgi:hypothetical protein